MSSERDIDDILESLNQLLREGESHNDDHVESDEIPETDLQAGEEAPQEPGQESALAETEEIPVADEEPADAVEDERVSEPADSGLEAVSEPEEQEKADDGDDSAGENDESSLSMPRVVLTEEMLVDNPQGSLLSLVRAAEAKAAVRSEAGGVDDAEERQNGQAPVQSPLHVDHEHMGRLLEQLSDDVINQLRQELPTLIRDSLYRHLEELNTGYREPTGAADEQQSAQQQLKEQKRDE